MTNNNDISVWEWQDLNETWVPHLPAVCHLLENIRSKGLVTAHLGDIEPSLTGYSVHFGSLRQINNVNGTSIPVRRMIYPANAATWYWSDTGKWNLYQIEVQNFIENVYQQGLGILNLNDRFPHLPYTLNFHSMTQTSLKTGLIRTLLRQQGSAYPIVKIPNSTQTPFPAGSAHSEKHSKPVTKTRRSKQNSASALTTVAEALETNSATNSIAGTSVKHCLSESDSPKPEMLRIKKTRSSGKNKSESCSLLQRLASPMRSVASLLSSNSSSPPKKKVGKANSFPSFMPHPPPSTKMKQKPVPGVKLPSEICVINESVKEEIDVVLRKYTKTVTKVPKNEVCSICCENLNSASPYDGKKSVVELNSCSHTFHMSCICAMYDSSNKNGFIECPVCKLIYGIKIGNQPPGRMEYSVLPCSIPAYPDCNCIVIKYYIPPGIQGSEHPSPGRAFSSRGFPRQCYLPDNEDGRKVLRLLVTAWERRLVFTIGTSSTTGEDETVTWNEIHHKTEFGSNYSGHGFPDPFYIENVLQELALQGVSLENS